MDRAKINGVELEYEVRGSGEPLLLINPVVAEGFVPLLTEPALVDRYRLIRYHKRGWGGSTHTPPPVSVADHALDAAALLAHLGVARAHVAGHSSGGAVALQLAIDRPEMVQTLVLLEPSLLFVPGAALLFEDVGPSLQAYHGGNPRDAVLGFLSVVSGLEREACREVVDARVPGAIEQAVRDADTFFGIELPGLAAWEFGPADARKILQPALSVLGAQTRNLWVEVDELLHAWLPRVERLTVDGVGHLLHMQNPEPVARGVAGFLRRHPMHAGRREAALRG
jgi:pimeloyl-ACP methyl ester carboxylesterase